MAGWARASADALDRRVSQYGHVVVETPSGEGFALFGGFTARHAFRRLYLDRAHRTRTRVSLHSRNALEYSKAICARYGLVVFCGNSVPPGLANELLAVPVTLDLDRPTPTTFDRPCEWSDSAKSSIRRIRKAGFTVDLAGADWAGEFYDRMWRPSMRSRHGAEAFLTSKRRLIETAKGTGCEFLRVWLNGRCIAASFNTFDANAYRCVHLGWRDADYEWWKAGAVSATYWFAMHRAAALGCGLMSFGACSPFLTDGILRHKANWGARFSASSCDNGSFQVLIDPSNETCQRFLRSQAIVVRGAGGSLMVLTGRLPGELTLPRPLIASLNRWYRWRTTPSPLLVFPKPELPSSLVPWLEEVDPPPPSGASPTFGAKGPDSSDGVGTTRWSDVRT